MLKTGHYRCAAQPQGDQVSLGDAIGHCRDGYHANEHPVFQFIDESDCIVAGHIDSHGRQKLHLAVFEAGAGAAVIETLEEVKVHEEPAPDDMQFIRAQVFLICSGNDAIFATHNMPLRDSRVSVLINNLVAKFSRIENPPTYLLCAVLDEERGYTPFV